MQREVFMLQRGLRRDRGGRTTLLYHHVSVRRAEAVRKSILLVHGLPPPPGAHLRTGRLSGMVEAFRSRAWPRKMLSMEGGAAVRDPFGRRPRCAGAPRLENAGKTSITTATGGRGVARWPPRPSTSSERGPVGSRLADLAKGCGARRQAGRLALIFQGYEILAQHGMDADPAGAGGTRLEHACGAVPGFWGRRFIDRFDTRQKAAAGGASSPLCQSDDPVRLTGAHSCSDVSLFSGEPSRWPCSWHHGAGGCSAGLKREAIACGSDRTAGDRHLPPLEAYRKVRHLRSREEGPCRCRCHRRLMRQGVRCGRMFAVVCRDIGKYRAAVRYKFRMAGHPSTAMSHLPRSSAPQTTAVRALLALARRGRRPKSTA